MKHRTSRTDHKVEQIIGNLLRGGVLMAAIVVLIGGVLYLRHHGRSPADYHAFRSEPSQLKSADGILQSALKLDSLGMIQLGLLLLILTPIARVVFSVFAFALERDLTYVIVTLVVIAVLIYSLAGSK